MAMWLIEMRSLIKKTLTGLAIVCLTSVQQLSAQSPEVRNILNNSAGDRAMYDALVTYYPEEAERMIEFFQSLVDQRMTQDEFTRTTTAFGQQFSQQNAHHIFQAPIQFVEQLLVHHIDTINHISANYGWQTCNLFVSNGPAGLPPEDIITLTEDVDPSLGFDLVEAIYFGETMPAGRSAPADQDYMNLFRAIEGKVSQTELDIIFNGDFSSPITCGALVNFVTAAMDAEYNGRDRVLAQILELTYNPF